MATILLTWELGAGMGHCVNLRPIADGLIARGHTVCLAARDLATARQVFQQTPVTYFQAPFLVGSSRSVVREPQTFAQILHNVGFGDDDQLEVLTRTWRSLLELIKPQAIVCEHSPTALLASRWMELRRWVVGTGFFSPPNASPLPNIRPGAPDQVADEARACERLILERVNRLLGSDSRPPLESLAGLYAEVDGNFLLTFRELDHYVNRTCAEYFGAWSSTGGVTRDWPVGRPRIFAYLKPPTAAWRLETFLSLIRELDYPMIAYLPGVDSTWLAKFHTSQAIMLTEPADLRQVACQSDVAIHNGNAGTATALLLAGVPQLLIPLHLEQAVFSQRVVELGAGLAARPDRMEQIAARLTTMVQSSVFKARAEEFARRYVGFQPVEQQTRIIERITGLLAC